VLDERTKEFERMRAWRRLLHRVAHALGLNRTRVVTRQVREPGWATGLWVGEQCIDCGETTGWRFMRRQE